jgi:WD40 repeat protein
VCCSAERWYQANTLDGAQIDSPNRAATDQPDRGRKRFRFRRDLFARQFHAAGERASTLRLLEVASGKERAFVPLWSTDQQRQGDLAGYVARQDRRVAALAFSPDGRTLAVGFLRTIYLFDTLALKEIGTLQGGLTSGQIFGRTLAFSPDGKVIAAGTVEGSLRLWQADTLRVLRDVPAHNEMVTALSFAPDGTTMASASLDTTILLWDVADLLKII